MYDVYQIRRDFPVLNQTVNGKYNAYLDTGASAQKPRAVIEAMRRIYENEYANVHRGAYHLSELITADYERARETVRGFINAADSREIVFTRNATESINLVAAAWGRQNLKAGDEILISEAEHHANLVPWQLLCEEKGCKLQVFKLAENGAFVWENFAALLNDKTKLVAVTAMSNVLGTVYPVKEIAAAAHRVGAKVLIDACQLAVHHQIDVRDIDCDFLAFSGHKVYGPTGIGVLYGKLDILQTMPPYQSGGDMVANVTFAKTTFDEPPARFEAGTPAFVQAIGLEAALNYMQNLGLENITAHETELTAYAIEAFKTLKGITLVGTAPDKGGVFAFNVDGIHPQDLCFILDKEGVSIRTGHFCAQPIVNRFGYESLARASLGLYSTREDIDALVAAIRKAQTFF